MIEIEASVAIDREPERVWDYMSRFEHWWLASNPDEHIELAALDQGEIGEGTRLTLKERIAGVRGEAIITIRAYREPERLEWASLSAKYTVLGIGINVAEGGVFKILKTENGCVLSHRVWGKLNGVGGAVVEWFFKVVLKGECKDYEHTARELRFIKREVERRSA